MTSLFQTVSYVRLYDGYCKSDHGAQSMKTAERKTLLCNTSLSGRLPCMLWRASRIQM